jgi:ketosteroid isomerase-like protein
MNHTSREHERRSAMSTKETIQKYYDGIAKKKGWQSVISNEIKFSGTGVESAQGKDAYIEATERFLQVVKTSQVKMMIIEDDKACVVVQYNLKKSPKRKNLILDVAEILSVKNEKINSFLIFFDTLKFALG